MSTIVKKSTVFYLLFSFLSALGDTVFLFGIPLYLYQENGKQLSYSALVPFIIILTIFIFKKFIFKVNHLNALFLVATGELAMGIIELLLLVSLAFFNNSSVVILLMLIPLALTYNIYSASKRLKIQDYFFIENKVFLNGIHSTLDRLGRLCGFFLAGLILDKFSIFGLILFDSITFFSFGLFSLFYYITSKSNPHLKSLSTEDNEQDIIPNSSLQTKLIFIFLITLNLFLSWENSSFVPSIQRESNISIFSLAESKALLNLVGLVFGLVIIKFLTKNISQMLYFFIALLLTTLLFTNGIVLFYAISLIVGVFSIILVSFQRGLIKKFANNKRSLSEVSTNFWYFQVVTSFSILPINFLSDKFDFLKSNNILILCYLLIGIMIGFIISKFYLEKNNYEF